MNLSAAPPELNPSSLDVWIVEEQAFIEPRLLACYEALLTESEVMRWRSFYFQSDRRRYLLTRALQRYVLSHYCREVLPEQWRFHENDFGKPSIVPEMNAMGLHFNLSHTAGIIAMAVSSTGEVGIDTESVRHALSVEAAELVLHDLERQQLDALPLSSRGLRFTALWTLKEACLKAEGVGLSGDLKDKCFEFERGECALGDFTCTGVRSGTHLQLFELPGELVLSVAAKSSSPTYSPEINLRRTIPFEKSQTCVPLRSYTRISDPRSA